MGNKILKDFSHCSNCPAFNKSVFKGLENVDLDKISDIKSVNHYKKGQDLFLENAPSNALYCIAEGNIKLSKMSKDGKETIVRIASKSGLVGHRSVFSDGGPYRASATCLSESYACLIEKVDILRLVENSAGLAMSFLKRISKDLELSENRFANFSHFNVRERVAALLLYLKNHFGEEEATGILLNIKLTRDEMASLIGVAKESLIRCFAEFKDEEILLTDSKLLVVLDVDKLKDILSL